MTPRPAMRVLSLGLSCVATDRNPAVHTTAPPNH